MSRFDHSDLDGHLLTLLVAVVEERSVTRAAQRLGVSQSAVSHLLDKLRAIVGDPLVVRSGRGIVPTGRAELLADRARPVLDDLRGVVRAGGVDRDHDDDGRAFEERGIRGRDGRFARGRRDGRR